MTQPALSRHRYDAAGPEWLLAHTAVCVDSPCPNCGAASGRRAILRLPWPGAAPATLLRCLGCGCGYFTPAHPAAYEHAQAGGEAALAVYLQQGVGLWGIASNLAALGRPPGTTLLEVGCGFGFGLDFARCALGWEVCGLDPSPFAAAGRRQLGLPIEPRYLEPAGQFGTFDVVMASEVIEHVASPPDFVRTLWGALRAGGTLVLTTPDVDAASPGTAPGLLVPLLSAGYHLVLQSVDSLAALLRDAGFVGVTVRRSGGASLLAHGHRGDGWPRPVASAGDAYDRYLHTAAAASEPHTDLWFGFVARSYRQAVNRADRVAADAEWAVFSAGCRERFGVDPEHPPAPAAPFTLEALTQREPLCLGPVLFHRAMHRLLLDEGRTTVEPVLVAAAEACARLRGALQAIGSEDGDAEDIGWLASAEAILCAAERGAAGVPARLAALGPPPGPPAGRTLAFRRRAFVALVNAGRLDDAGALADAVEAVKVLLAEGAVLESGELDVLYCAATRELQRPGGSPAAALGLLDDLDAACSKAAGAGGSAITLAAPAQAARILAMELLRPARGVT